MADGSPPPPPAPLLGPPAGYTMAGPLPMVAVQRANEVLESSLRYGESVDESFDGKTYLFRVEPHYDDHVDGITHWRRGVTVYAANAPSPAPPSSAIVLEPVPVTASPVVCPEPRCPCSHDDLWWAVGALAVVVLWLVSQTRRL